jgi:quercetin dioxygenase-like cupin family protein
MSGRGHFIPAQKQPATVPARTAPNDANGSGSGPASKEEYHMMLRKWLRPDRVMIAVAAVTAGVLACRDTTTPKQLSTDDIQEPAMTMAVGFVSVVNGRGNLGTFHVQSKFNGYDVELKSHDNTDIAVADITIAPNGTSGWHYHPGPVLVVVKSGAVTFYTADGPDCSPVRHPAGTVFIEPGGVVGNAINREATDTKVVATFFAPAGSPLRIDAPKPANCEV